MLQIIRKYSGPLPMSLHSMKRDAELLQRLLGIDYFDVSLTVAGDRFMRQISKQYLGQSTKTDILSFPGYPVKPPGAVAPFAIIRPGADAAAAAATAAAVMVDGLPSEMLADLGDMYLNVDCVLEDCAKDKVPFDHRFPVLIAHGLCHLMGYDHDTEAASRLMFEREKSVLDRYSIRKRVKLSPLPRYTNESDTPA